MGFNKNKIFKVYLIYFISVVGFCILRIVANLDLYTNSYAENVSGMFTLIIQLGLMFVLPFILSTMFNRTSRNPIKNMKNVFKEAHFYKINYKVMLFSILIGLVVFILNIAISTVFNGLISFTGYKPPTTLVPPYKGTWLNGTQTFIFNIVFVAILPAFCEEFLHRGILLNGIKKIGIKKAILISSLCFGLIHFNVQQFFYAFALGALMALVAVVSKSIVPAMIIHFINNFISVYLESAEANGWFLGGFNNGINNFLVSSNGFLTFLACFLAITLAVVIIVFAIMKIFKYTTFDKVQRAINSVYESGDVAGNTPIVVDKTKALHEILDTNSSLNLNFEEMKSPIDIVLPKQKFVVKTDLKDNLFLICSITLGVLVTLFTFVWGFY